MKKKRKKDIIFFFIKIASTRGSLSFSLSLSLAVSLSLFLSLSCLHAPLPPLLLPQVLSLENTPFHLGCREQGTQEPHMCTHTDTHTHNYIFEGCRSGSRLLTISRCSVGCTLSRGDVSAWSTGVVTEEEDGEALNSLPTCRW